MLLKNVWEKRITNSPFWKEISDSHAHLTVDAKNQVCVAGSDHCGKDEAENKVEDVHFLVEVTGHRESADLIHDVPGAVDLLLDVVESSDHFDQDIVGGLPHAQGEKHVGKHILIVHLAQAWLEEWVDVSDRET